MKILTIGSSGQVAQAMNERSVKAGVQNESIGRPTLDILRPESIEIAIDRAEPTIIVNAAAYTAVDRAEDDPGSVFELNANAPEHLAKVANARGIPLVHISTDYVFDGKNADPYREDDSIAPLGVYGQSKAQGERKVLEASPRSLILRTAWVYSPFGNNFVKTMLKLAAERESVSVVDDQVGNPTNALDIADGILSICEHLGQQGGNVAYGLYHMTARGRASWADLAEKDFDVYRQETGKTVHLNRISSSEYPTPVERPNNSQLDSEKLANTFSVTLPEWKTSVEAVVRRLISERNTSQ